MYPQAPVIRFRYFRWNHHHSSKKVTFRYKTWTESRQTGEEQHHINKKTLNNKRFIHTGNDNWNLFWSGDKETYFQVKHTQVVGYIGLRAYKAIFLATRKYSNVKLCSMQTTCHNIRTPFMNTIAVSPGGHCPTPLNSRVPADGAMSMDPIALGLLYHF